MARGWRALVTAAVTAVIATTAVAVAVQAAPAPQGSPAPSSSGGPGPAAPAHSASPIALAAVTEHALDPQLLASVAGTHGGGAQSVTETIQLAVLGGELSLATEGATVVLTRVPGSLRDWTGLLPPVQVVDARGTGAGWRVVWRVAALDVQTGPTRRDHTPATAVHLEPEAPTVVAGSPDGIAAGPPARGVPSGSTLLRAGAGYGGGTYEAGAAVSVRLPAAIDADAVVVELVFSLA